MKSVISIRTPYNKIKDETLRVVRDTFRVKDETDEIVLKSRSGKFHQNDKR